MGCGRMLASGVLFCSQWPVLSHPSRAGVKRIGQKQVKDFFLSGTLIFVDCRLRVGIC